MEYKSFCEALARDAGTIMLKHFASPTISIKSDKSPVTRADIEVNSLVIERVRKMFPGDGILGEEESFPGTNNRLWVCDPLDGTLTYSTGLRYSTFGIALVVDGEPIINAVYQPFSDEFFYAEKGKGATCNGEALRMSDNGLRVVAVEINELSPFPSPASYNIDLCKQKFKTIGLYAMHTCCLQVAKGNFCATVFGNPTPWDVAPIKVIVEEAGGRVTDVYGREQRYDGPIRGAVVSNGVVHKQVMLQK